MNTSTEVANTFVLIAAIVGSGLVTGILFAFSNFVMKSLAELPTKYGALAMQEINKRIINPAFMALFIGTPLLCLIISFTSSSNTFSFYGAMLYLVGPFGITILRNVPLNNQLATKSLDKDIGYWELYQTKWQRWNHIRTYLGLSSFILLSASSLSL